jgi:uncharacterized heparinase superfamily protein
MRSLRGDIGTLTQIRRFMSTIRHLRPSQIVDRIQRRLRPPRLDDRPDPWLRSPIGPWVSPAARGSTMTGPDVFSIFGQSARMAGPEAWNDPDRDKLWLYHCHYFEDLLASGAENRGEWHRALIGRWIRENPPGHGNGWEPYPLSLRISNWLMWSYDGNRLDPSWQHSLVLQVRWLRQSLEWHLQANHLLANAKALVLAGCWADGEEGEQWFVEGIQLLQLQVQDQILSDGGHIERSPMYHSLVLNDLFDVINALSHSGIEIPQWLSLATAAMSRWLVTLCHPDGEIPLFNDAAFGMAPSPSALAAYAGRLGLSWPSPSTKEMEWLPDSGYARLGGPGVVLYCDAAPLGPDWQPGHGHADSLTWECSIHGRRVIVDPGTSTYAAGAERLRQRGTGAHNTVCIDGKDSSEVWSSFRVGRRARITRTSPSPIARELVAAHDGYSHIGIRSHARLWRLLDNGIEIDDEVVGSGRHHLLSGILLHPDWRIVHRVDGSITIAIPDWDGPHVHISGAPQLNVEQATYHPFFGKSIDTIRIIQETTCTLPAHLRMRISWA